MSPLVVFIGGSVITVLTYYASNPKHNAKRAYRIAAVPMVLTLVLGGLQCKADYDKARESATSGLLRPERDDGVRDTITVHVGTDVFKLTGTWFRGGREFSLSDYVAYVRFRTPLRVRLDDDGIKVSGLIHSLVEGEAVAGLENNRWTTGNTEYFKRRYDKSRFEIIDKHGIICFQVRLLTPTSMRISGIIPTEGGGLTAIDEEGVTTATSVNLDEVRRKLNSGEWVVKSLFE